MARVSWRKNGPLPPFRERPTRAAREEPLPSMWSGASAASSRINSLNWYDGHGFPTQAVPSPEALALDVAKQIGPYHILGPLGAGGMGEVYLAEDSRLGRKVAIKVLSSRQAINDEARARFLREARSIASLDHSNICTLYEIGNDQGMDYLVMQYIEGETLAQRLVRQPFMLPQALEVAVEIGEGLIYAHSRGIVHRDIKPQNIMFTAEGRVKLMDFGVAKNLDTLQPSADSETALFVTQAGIPVGTIEYMAPEQIEGAPADVRSDIFSFGIVIYQLLGQKHPFLQESFSATLAAILTRDPAPLHDLPPAVEPELARILGKALAKKPAERFQTSRELTGDLRSLRQRVEEQARMPVTGHPVPTKKRSRALALWGVAALLLTGVAAIGLLPSGALPWHKTDWTADRGSPSPPAPPSPGGPVPATPPGQRNELQSLTYWLEVQAQRTAGTAIQRSLGEETFHSGNRFRLGIEQSRRNWFYLLDQSSSTPGQEFTLLYPASITPAPLAGEKFPQPAISRQNQGGAAGPPPPLSFYTDWYVFDQSPGTETLWLVSAEIPVVEIEGLRPHLNKGERGVVRAPHEVLALQTLLESHQADKVEMQTEESPKEVTVQYHGTLVKALNLTHR